MTYRELVLAAKLNEQGRRLSDEGDVTGAESAYREALRVSPEWSVPAYNLGLLFKVAQRWEESLVFNQLAARLAPDDQASWWNLGIAATALGNWPEARRAWKACGTIPPEGDGPPDFGWGATPVRLDPETSGEVVWARRLDPARAQIENIPLQTSRYGGRDIVLIDGAVDGERIVGGRAYPVFNVLTRLEGSSYRKFIIELATIDPDAVDSLEKCATEQGGSSENWGTATRILCEACSKGAVHQHAESESAAHPHCGLAARDHAHASDIIEAWLAGDPRADIIDWYEATSA